MPTDAFGSALASDGDRVVVGAPGANGGVGVIFVFDLHSGQQINAFTEPGGGCPGDNFGAISLAISGDTLFASAFGWSAPTTGCNATEFFEGRVWSIDLRTGEANASYGSPTQTLDQLFGWGLMSFGDDLLVDRTTVSTGCDRAGRARQRLHCGRSEREARKDHP